MAPPVYPHGYLANPLVPGGSTTVGPEVYSSWSAFVASGCWCAKAAEGCDFEGHPRYRTLDDARAAWKQAPAEQKAVRDAETKRRQSDGGAQDGGSLAVARHAADPGSLLLDSAAQDVLLRAYFGDFHDAYVAVMEVAGHKPRGLHHTTGASAADGGLQEEVHVMCHLLGTQNDLRLCGAAVQAAS